GRARRTLRIDGEPVTSQAALAAIVRVIWLTPEMDRLFQEGAPARLRFLDRLVCGFDPSHAARSSAYSQAMRERSRLLKDGAGDDIWLTTVEQRLAEQGVAIAAARRDTVSRLRAAGHIAPPFPAAGMALVGELEDWLDEAPALAVEDRLRAALAATRRHDTEQGGTAHGPHRCDLAVHHLDKDAPAARCSTGEQKAMLIAIMLAYARLQAVAGGAPPLLLLDEVVAHLDAPRRAALFGHIGALGAQAWLTGTDTALFEPLRGRARFLRIESAAIAPES
ncbi:MAG: DNA replication/repair protein RecF, partial [Alphaproteobacteria bacterium]